jgi:polyhydroxybutyrate depolymerase
VLLLIAAVVVVATLAVILPTPSTGSDPSVISVPATSAPGGIRTTTTSLSVGGVARTFVVLAPTAQTSPLPVIVVLQGSNAAVSSEITRDEFTPLVRTDEAILVYPAGYGESWNVAADNCCGPAAARGVDDVAFIADVVARLRVTQSMQADHIYLVGFSNGGKLAYQVMCTEPQLFDAFAVVAATPLSTCRATVQPPRSVLIAVGAEDPELPISSLAVPAAQALAGATATWRERDGCSASAATATTIGSATISTWSSCAGRTRVQAVQYVRLPHLWPTSSLVGSAASGASLIWKFFSVHGAQDVG